MKFDIKRRFVPLHIYSVLLRIRNKKKTIPGVLGSVGQSDGLHIWAPSLLWISLFRRLRKSFLVYLFEFAVREFHARGLSCETKRKTCISMCALRLVLSTPISPPTKIWSTPEAKQLKKFPDSFILILDIRRIRKPTCTSFAPWSHPEAKLVDVGVAFRKTVGRTKTFGPEP